MMFLKLSFLQSVQTGKDDAIHLQVTDIRPSQDNTEHMILETRPTDEILQPYGNLKFSVIAGNRDAEDG